MSGAGAVARVAALDRERLFAEFVATSRPVVITGAARSWPAFARWTPESLVAELGDAPVRLASSSGGRFEYQSDSRQFDVRAAPLREAVAQLAAAADGAHLYVMQQPLVGPLARLGNDLRFGQWLGDEPAVPHLWYGTRNNISPLHYDAVNNLYAQLRGEKRFTLYPPTCTAALYPYPVDAKFCHLSQVDIDAHDPVRFPRFADARAEEVTLEPGDILYLPAFYWHHVRSLSTSLSVNSWWAPTFEQCLSEPGRRMMPMLYERDRFASMGAPISSFPGGFIAAARRAQALGQPAVALLFAAAAVERHHRQPDEQTIGADCWRSMLARAVALDDTALATGAVDTLLLAADRALAAVPIASRENSAVALRDDDLL
jgi:jumonji domain-containing protein 7